MSKRETPATRQRWYSAEELAKIRKQSFEVHPDICGRPAPMPRRTGAGASASDPGAPTVSDQVGAEPDPGPA